MTKPFGSNFAPAILLLVAVMGHAEAQAPEQGHPEPAITVSATGSVSLEPDYAVILVSVVTRDAQAARAGEQNARQATAVRQVLRQLLRVPDDSLPTVHYSVDTEYDRERGRPSGYAARSTIEARVRDLTAVGRLVDAALGAGATNIANIRFESTRRDAARLQALARAVESARGEAEAIARAAGGELGALLEVTTGPMTIRRAREVAVAAAMRAAAPDTPISPPELEVTATVTARWAFVARR